jgi:glycosyl transferase family 2
MVYKVRDEADIIEDNLRFHLAQGVDFFVVVDTGSVDGTIEILERYERAGVLRLERTIGGIHDMKSGGEESVTRLAAEMGADWIVHNDADEFWWPAEGDLKQSFESVPDEFGMVLAPRTEFVVRPGDGPFAERMTVRETRFRRPAKSAHRPSERISLRGPHPVEIWTGDSAYRGLVGKPVLRTEAEHREDDPMELVITPTFPVGVLHFPFRTFEQYRRRVEIARDNGQLERNEAGQAVRRAYEENRLEEVYERLVLADDAVAKGVGEGWLTEQTSFRDYLGACPDPLNDPDTGAPPVPDGGGGPTAEQLRDDSMYAISRYLQTQAERAMRHRRQGARVREFRQRLKRRNSSLRIRTNRLRRIESSLWWRMRPRVPRAVGRFRRTVRRRLRRRRRG